MNEELSKAQISTGCGQLVYDESGINLRSEKKTMMEIRLKRRVHSLGHFLAGRVLRPCFSAGGAKRAS